MCVIIALLHPYTCLDFLDRINFKCYCGRRYCVVSDTSGNKNIIPYEDQRLFWTCENIKCVRIKKKKHNIRPWEVLAKPVDTFKNQIYNVDTFRSCNLNNILLPTCFTRLEKIK